MVESGQKLTAPLRVALVGYGVGGAVFHAPLVSAVQNLRLAAIVTASEARVAQARQDYPEARIVPDFAAILADAKSYDLVVVCSPNKYHFEQAAAALAAGLHVVIDKPMAISSGQCHKLIDVAREHDRLLSVFQNRRLDGDFLTLKKIIADRTIGEIVRFESRFDRWRPVPRAGAWREQGGADDGGGLLFDLGSHLIDQACQLFGDPLEVYCELDRRRPGVTTNDDCFVALTFENDVRAHLHASVFSRINGPRFKLFGLGGTYEKYGLDPQEDTLRAGGRPGDAGWGLEAEALWGDCLTGAEGAEKFKLATEKGSYEQFYAQIAEALLHYPEVPPAVAPQEALRTALIIEAAYRSAAEKVVVEI